MKLAKMCVALLFISGGAYAQDFQIVGSIQKSVPTTAPSALRTTTSIPTPQKSITLLKMQLSPQAQTTIKKRLETLSEAEGSTELASIASAVQLGMGNVPVLDQGPHGTCVTFATTAAVDAVLNKGDYISQLCQLQLGRHLETQAYSPSGWEGSYGPIVLAQMSMFGIVSKTKQQSSGCGGVTEYPLTNLDPQGGGASVPGLEMSVPEFHQLSENLPGDDFAWSPIVDMYQVGLDNPDMNQKILEIKRALSAGDRVTFGTLLFDFDKGVVGAVGTYHAKNDTWVLTPELTQDLQNQPEFGGHEMLITGYDDNAVATDEQGRQYHGLFTIRNSWGDKVGDKGNFYISYTYLKTLIIEAQRIRKLPTN